MKIALATRFKIIGVEVIGLGSFLLIELGLSLRHAGTAPLQGFSWDFGFIALLLIIVGFEILLLIKDLPPKRAETETDLSLRNVVLDDILERA